MPIQINSDLITIVSISFGLICLLLAIYQTITMRRARKIYESHCRGKCRDIVDLTRSMTSEVIEACEILGRELKNRNDNQIFNGNQIAFLVAKVNGIRVLTARLSSFCDNLNEEHKDQFGKLVFQEMIEELPHRECLHTMVDINGNPVPPSEESYKRQSNNTQADHTEATEPQHSVRIGCWIISRLPKKKKEWKSY